MKKAGICLALLFLFSVESHAGNLVKYCKVMSNRLSTQAEIRNWTYGVGWNVNVIKRGNAEATSTSAFAFNIKIAELKNKYPKIYTWSTSSLINAWTNGLTPRELKRKAYSKCLTAKL